MPSLRDDGHDLRRYPLCASSPIPMTKIRMYWGIEYRRLDALTIGLIASEDQCEGGEKGRSGEALYVTGILSSSSRLFLASSETCQANRSSYVSRTLVLQS